MRSFLPGVVCVIVLSTASTYGQNANIQPVHAAAGTVLTFYSQTLLHPAKGNVLDVLPRGTAVKVKLLESVDSDLDRDGLEFRGVLMAPLTAGGEVLVHRRASVRGRLVLLRSRSHPEGFRYELLITSITEAGKLYELTASLNPSFSDTGGPADGRPAPATSDSANEQGRLRLRLNNKCRNQRSVFSWLSPRTNR